MTDLESRLRDLIAAVLADRRSLRWVAHRAGVPYDATYAWWRGRTAKLNVATADKLLLALTGEGLK